MGLIDFRQITLTIYDTDTLLPACEGPTHVLADKHGRLLVADTRGGAILVYALEPDPPWWRG